MIRAQQAGFAEAMGDDNSAMRGFQLRTRLPAAQKMMLPRYRGITADPIQEAELDALSIESSARQAAGNALAIAVQGNHGTEMTYPLSFC